MKRKLFGVALVASAVTIAQANPEGVPAAKGASHSSTVAPNGSAILAPTRPSGVSSFGSPPMLSYGSRPFYPGQRYSSFGIRSSPSSAYRPPFYSSRGSFTRSGPYTVATIPRVSGLQPTRLPLQQRDRVAPFANRRNPAVARVWNQRNTGTQFRNGNNLRNAKQSAEWKQFAKRKQFPKWKQPICVVTGKNTFSVNAQGIGIATGIAIATIGGMATNAPSLMERG